MSLTQKEIAEKYFLTDSSKLYCSQSPKKSTRSIDPDYHGTGPTVEELIEETRKAYIPNFHNKNEEFKGIFYHEREDPRKVALKKGLRQLTLKQLYRVMDKMYATVGTGVCLDEYSYEDGKFCPLAIGVGLDEAFKDPSNEKVFAVLVLMGYSVFSTRNVKGEFYTKNRLQDLITATVEVIEEKKKTFAQEVKEQNLTYFTKETKNG